MVKMHRKIISQFYGRDSTLKLYTPYLQISILPRKRTETGEHDLKLCLSVGREFDEEKAITSVNLALELLNEYTKYLARRKELLLENGWES